MIEPRTLSRGLTVTDSFAASNSLEAHARLASAARQLSGASTLDQTVGDVARLALDAIKGTETACATLLAPPKELFAASDEDPVHSRLVQNQDGPGPLDDLIGQTLVSAADLTQDIRWPAWTRRAVEESGIRSVLFLRLFTETDHLGVLALFSREPHAFDPEDHAVAVSFAAIASSILQTVRTREQLQNAVEARTVIGQAQGVIMERLHVSAEQAFEMLKRISQNANIRIQELAVETIHSREHPDVLTRNPGQLQP